MAIKADVADPSAVEKMFESIETAWDGIDILVNNAGIDGGRAFGWESIIAAWKKVIEVNLLGAFYCSREALRRMVPQKSGVILTISSVHEEIAWSGYSAYTASKAAVSMLTKTLAQEAAPHGVRVLAVAPGAIKTPQQFSLERSRKAEGFAGENTAETHWRAGRSRSYGSGAGFGYCHLCDRPHGFR